MTIPDDIGDLAALARKRHVVVVGGGIAGLVAALECAKVGVRVTVLEASDAVGGVLQSVRVAGLRLDVGADSWATRGGTVRRLVDDLGLGDAVLSPAAGRAWVAGLPGDDAAPLPEGGVLGIPGNPWHPDVRRILGTSGSWRAYLDRVRPPLTIGHERSLGALVRRRMGQKVLDRLVAPVTTGVYSALPDDIDVEVAAPGLNAAMTRLGSLSGAVTALRGDRAPGAAVEGLDGGMSRLVEALVRRLTELGAELRTNVAVSALHRRDAHWDVSAGPQMLTADAVILAVSETEARRLLAAVVPGVAAAAGPAPVVEIVTLVIHAPALDAHPRGTGVLTVPGSHAAKALTHSSAKWGWIASSAGPGVHVVRVSFGAQGEDPATARLDDDAAAALALVEASALLGVPLDIARLRGAHRARHTQSQPAATLGRAETVAAVRASIAGVPGLAAVGAWLSGTGLAQVVPDATAEADRVRLAVLFGVEPSAP